MLLTFIRPVTARSLACLWGTGLLALVACQSSTLRTHPLDDRAVSGGDGPLHAEGGSAGDLGAPEGKPPVLPPPPPSCLDAPGTKYYLAPAPLGSDASHDGRSAATPWATFARAWSALQPGDALILLDGTYTQALAPSVRDGTAGSPIWVCAQHDGEVLIDGEGQRVPISFRRQANGWNIGSYFIVEGVVAANSSASVVEVAGDHNVLRRVSAYHANTDENEHVIVITGGFNVVEDCVASGTGRKAVLIYGTKDEENVVRRCFAAWHHFRGLNFPPNDFVGVQIYGGKNNIIENAVTTSLAQVSTYDFADFTGISMMANDPSLSATGNRTLGSVAFHIGMRFDGSPLYVAEAAGSNCWGYCRSGFNLHGNQSQVTDNVYQDILAFKNGGPGLGRLNVDANFARNQLIRATLVQNNIGQPTSTEGAGVNVLDHALAQYDTVQDCWVDGRTEPALQGHGARLAKRYVNGALTGEDLWPWPMEARIREELAQYFGVANYSVTCQVGTVINDLYAQGKVAEPIAPSILAAACGN